MAWVKVTDIAYGRLKAPDLDVMEEFLTRFGMHRTERTASALYMRGTDPAHHIHVTEKGDPKFVGLAYYADDEDDLKRLAKAPGARQAHRTRRDDDAEVQGDRRLVPRSAGHDLLR
jgi:hypothetical protein